MLFLSLLGGYVLFASCLCGYSWAYPLANAAATSQLYMTYGHLLVVNPLPFGASRLSAKHSGAILGFSPLALLLIHRLWYVSAIRQP
ncbi:unnamed protein product [Clonostachys rosea]|uniref:Uncharacterized protein n=1 Tax=Bionectria ochroleuca TaxID=29856 RepID=A0ABY6TSN6_BIOOC|nr:unnamed protein product [Clonostachys rosea]